MVGTRLLHYVIEARLGAGGMGTVYLARDTVLDRTVAIKVLEVGDADARARLLHEARAASALNHPNIVTIHAVEQQGDTAFIVMEHVEGVPLHRAIPEGGLPVAGAVRHALGLAEALAAAHAHGVVHRDIKPANVIVTTDGRVKVLDFGIARRTALPDEATRAGTLGVARALAKDPARRFASGRELFDALSAVQAALQPAPRPGVPGSAFVAAAVRVLAVAGAALWWQRAREAERRWVHDEAIPEIGRLATSGDPAAAYRLARRALAITPNDAPGSRSSVTTAALSSAAPRWCPWATTSTPPAGGSTTTTRARSTLAWTNVTTARRSGRPSGFRSPPPTATNACR